MTDIVVDCPKHGFVTVSNLIEVGNGTLVMTGGRTNCPICGRIVPILDGIYQRVGDVVRVILQPGLHRNQIAHFKEVAAKARAGSLSQAEAEQELADLPSALLAIWSWANSNAGGLGILLTILTIYLTLTAGWGADQQNGKIVKALEAQTEISRAILKEVRRRHPPVVTPPPERQSSRPPPVPRFEPPTSMVNSPNRHERRKAARLSKRGRY